MPRFELSRVREREGSSGSEDGGGIRGDRQFPGQMPQLVARCAPRPTQGISGEEEAEVGWDQAGRMGGDLEETGGEALGPPVLGLQSFKLGICVGGVEAVRCKQWLAGGVDSV